MPGRSSTLLNGTFSSSLRKRPLWQVLEPVLTASASQFQEYHLQDYDFTFNLTSNSRHIKILLLSNSSLDPLNKQETITRLERFSPFITSSPPNNAVAFLLSEGAFTRASGKHSVDGLATLQVLMTESLPTAISIIPIPNLSSLLSSILGYMNNLVDILVQQPALRGSVTLLAGAVRSRYFQLSEQDTNTLSEIAPSLGFISREARTERGRELLRDCFGDALAREMTGFWEEDEQ